MPEPLKDRFAHVYIKTEREDWIKWAAQNHINPLIIGYLATSDESFFRMIGEKNVRSPRTWERASVQLDATQKLQSLYPILGEDITKNIIRFSNTLVYSKDELIDKHLNGILYDLNLDDRNKMAIMLSLLDCSISEYIGVRKQLRETLPHMSLLALDEMWVMKNEDECAERRKAILESDKVKPPTYDLSEVGYFEPVPIDADLNMVEDYFVTNYDEWDDYDPYDKYDEPEECDEYDEYDEYDGKSYEQVLKEEEEDRVDSMFDDVIGKFRRNETIRGNNKKSLRKTPRKFIKHEKSRCKVDR